MAVEGRVFEWDGTPWSCKIWAFDCKRVYGGGEHCEVPPGEPTGENIIPALPDRGFPNSMLSLKQMYCYAIKNGDIEEQQRLLDEMSRLREYWRQLRSDEKKSLLDKVYGSVGNVLWGTMKPFITAGAILIGMGVIAVGSIMYISSKTGTTRELTRALKPF